ncbi:nucleotidyltransferase family protein [Pararhizobium sp.]|uniref:nucleotidyltransferase family protein n=1 Tax=Pararhizobium sp. TaxID=1977563 RepID=UPI00271F0148|nr:nucleotidyltransferase family protein [Pararhizobium sp.]MDO9418480.1 nucleotidyltransferase family protein [Pararhizobium sp.]
MTDKRQADQSPVSDEVTTSSIAIVLLAAGTGRRMGDRHAHKLLADFDGMPLVRRLVNVALSCGAAPMVVVIGHRHNEISNALNGLGLTVVYNPDFETGMASSLRAGYATPGVRDASGVLVLLADMPAITTGHLLALMNAFVASEGKAIVRAASEQGPGNPVILPRSLDRAIMNLQGDVGARHVIAASAIPIIDVDIGAAAHLDVDTPQQLEAAGGRLT